MTKHVNILGEKYTVRIGVPFNEDPLFKNCDGYCTPSEHKIAVLDLKTTKSWDGMPDEPIQKVMRKNIRHEVIHAFLHESGIWENSLYDGAWALNEEMVDWIAMQWPKMRAVFIQLGCDE